MILDLLTKKYPGFRLWFLQRISGLIIAIFSITFIARLYFIDIHTFRGWKFFFYAFLDAGITFSDMDLYLLSWLDWGSKCY